MCLLHVGKIIKQMVLLYSLYIALRRYANALVIKNSLEGLVKKYWGGGPLQRGGGSLVFEPLVRDGSFNFQLPWGVGHPIL